MAENIDDITITFTENGVEVVKELDKVILSRGMWTTILFKYQEWDAKKNDYGPVKFSIRRYQKRGGAFSQRSKFNISSVDQARAIVEALQNWIGDDQSGSA